MVRAHEWDVSRRLARAPGGRRPWWVSHPVAPRPGLRLDVESAGSREVVAISGDVDGTTAAQLESFLADRSLAGCSVLELDLSGVGSLGSVGLSVLLAVRRRCLQRGIELRVSGAPPSVWRAFEVTGLDATFRAPAPVDRVPAQELALF